MKIGRVFQKIRNNYSRLPKKAKVPIVMGGLVMVFGLSVAGGAASSYYSSEKASSQDSAVLGAQTKKKKPATESVADPSAIIQRDENLQMPADDTSDTATTTVPAAVPSPVPATTTSSTTTSQISSPKITSQSEDVVTPIAYKTQRVASEDIATGTEEVTTPGKAGSTTTTYKVTYTDSIETGRVQTNQTTVEPTDEIVTYGTKPAS